MKKNEESLADL